MTPGKANYNLSTSQLIKENSKQTPRFKTLQSKLKITLNQNKKSQTYTLSLRIKKDEFLWVNAPFSVIRTLVTPQKISFYNKLDGTYFEGDYQYLSDMLGISLDFQKLQNLFLGNAMFNLKAREFKTSVIAEAYMLQPKKQQLLGELFFLLDPFHFKIKSHHISQPNNKLYFQIDYLKHQEVSQQILPEIIKVLATNKNEKIIMNLEFKGVSLNEDLTFPFKIPSGFKEIKL